MGDTGSLTLGYILAFLAIAYTNNNSERAPYTEGAIVVAFFNIDCSHIRCVPGHIGTCPKS